MRLRRAVLIFLTLACCLPASAAAAGPPTIEYFAPSPIRNHEATLRFSIDPEGLATHYEVKYGTAPGEYVPFSFWEFELPAGDEPVTLEAELPAHWMPELSAGAKYHWIVIAENSAGKTEGPEQSFTTTNEPAPQPVNGPVTSSTTVLTRFTGTVDPEGNPVTSCHFRWVTDSVHAHKGFEGWAATEMLRFGTTVPCAQSPAKIGSGNESVPVHAEVAGIDPGEYWVRLEADNAYEDGLPVGWGVPFKVTVPSDGEQSCPLVPGCDAVTETPAQAAPTQVTPAKVKPRKRKKHQRKRVRHNATIVAPR
jgi:hypothetical protein